MEEWKEYKVGDIFNIQNGYAFKSGEFVDYSEDTYEVLKIGHIEVGGGLRSDPKRTFVKRESKYLKWVLEKNDIVMGMTDMKSNVVILGIPALIDKSDKYVLNQRVARLSLKDSQSFDIYFCYYQMQWKEYISELRKTANSGVQVNLTTSGISNSLLFVPDFEIQKKIGGILRTLDDKIKNNRRVNDNLEQQAQALFKSWFVDFEPFKNGEFVESELGMIPKGWRVGTLDDLLEIKYGKDHKKLSDGKIPVYGSGGLMRRVDKSLYKGESVLIPRKGTLNNVMYVNEEFWTVDTMFYTIPKVEHIALFCYLFLLGKDLASMNAGSAVPSMTTEILNSMPVVIPQNSIVNEFDNVISSYFRKIENNDNESRRLSELRDTLLPKLMSGELKVNEIVA